MSSSASASISLTFGSSPRNYLGEPSIDLDGGDRSPGCQQRSRECSETGADLDDLIAVADGCKPSDALHRVRINDEVLAEGSVGRQTVTVEKFSGFGPSQRHRDQRTRTASVSPGEAYVDG